MNFNIKIKNNDEVGKLSEAFAKMTHDLASSRDNITQQNQKLETANEALVKLNEEKNSIIGIVAHYLRSPLASIEGLLEILKIETKSKG